MFGELYTIHMANDAKTGQNSTSQIHVKSEHGYSPKYTEQISSFIGLNLPRHGLDHKLRRQGFLICRNMWLSQFVMVQNTTSQIDFNSTRGCTPKYRKHAHIDIGPFQGCFLGTSFMGIITDILANRYNNEITPKVGKNATSPIRVKSDHGYSPKYTENVFNVIGHSLPRHGLDHKLRQITNCDGRNSWFVAICDCRNLGRFNIQLSRLMSIVPEGILLSTENTFT